MAKGKETGERTGTRRGTLDSKEAVRLLNRILEHELAGVVRYTHYSFMVFGYTRIPVIDWLREQAQESLRHAVQAGEHVTALGGHPSLEIGALLETHKHAVEEILTESHDHEALAVAAYEDLLAAVEGRSVMLEEYARSMVASEEAHLAEVRKLLRRPA